MARKSKYIRIYTVGMLAMLLSGGVESALGQGQAIGPTAQSSMQDKVRIEQRLDQQVPLDIPFKDEENKDIKLGDYFGKRPVILVMPFYKCAGTCILEMEGLMRACNALHDFDLGNQFDVVVVSINPKEGPVLAAEKKRDYLSIYQRPGTEKGMHCLTGDQASIERLADAVGFRYYIDPKSGAPVHSAGIMILTPRGKVSRYVLGVDYPPRDLRLTLVNASENRIGSLVDNIRLLCTQYDPSTGKYSVAIIRLLQITGCGTVLILGTFIFSMIRMERARKDKVVPSI
jgi:protein SCO1/2